jgi:hypothetical protein
MPKKKRVKKPRTIQLPFHLKQKQTVNIYTGGSKRAPLSRAAKPMPAMNNMPTFNPIAYRVQPVGTQTVELERRLNDEIKVLKSELNTIKEHKFLRPNNLEYFDNLKAKFHEHNDRLPESPLGQNADIQQISNPTTPSTAKKKPLSQMTNDALRALAHERGLSTDGIKVKRDLLALLNG